MTSDMAPLALFYAVLLLLPLSALAARRMAWRRSILMAIGWLAIFALAIAIFAERERVAAFGRAVAQML